jgi:hypothetical protein
MCGTTYKSDYTVWICEILLSLYQPGDQGESLIFKHQMSREKQMNDY